MKKFLIEKVTGYFLIQMCSFGLSLLLGICLTRFLSAENYGILSFSISTFVFIRIVSSLGLKQLLIREISAYRAQDKPRLISGILRFSILSSLTCSILLAIVIAGIIYLIRNNLSEELAFVFLLFLLILPIQVAQTLMQGIIHGFRFPLIAEVSEFLLKPIIMLVGILLVVYYSGQLTLKIVIYLTAFTELILYIVSTFLVLKFVPLPPKIVGHEYEIRKWLGSMFPMMLTSLTYIISVKADTVMLGFLGTFEDVALYSVASRGIGIISFSLNAVNSVASPLISQLYASGDYSRLQKLCTKSAQYLFLISIFIALAFLIFGKFFLSLFGSNYVVGYVPMMVLTFSQIINTFSGSPGQLLIMTGNENLTAKGIAVSSIANIFLNFFLIPLWGAVGAAVATGLSLVIWNILLVIWAKSKTGIHTTVLGKNFSLI